MFTQDGWMYGAIFFCCFFENASAMFCFMDFETSHDFPSTWGRVENDWIYILGIYFSFLSINFFFLSALDPIQIGRCNYKKKQKKTVLWSKHDMTVGVRTDPGSGVTEEKCVCEVNRRSGVTGWNAAFLSSSRCAGWRTLLMTSVT